MINSAEIVALLGAITGIVMAVRALRETRSADVRMVVETLQKRVTELERERDAMRQRIDELESENICLRNDLHVAQELVYTINPAWRKSPSN